tara:strand:+ start:42 stop:347 length:306 start_codon:yes stop_codon:yes gene_type:complete
MKITKLEEKTLVALMKDNDSIGWPCTASELREDPCVNGRIKDLARILELDKEVVKGVIGSLVKKGLVSTYFHNFDPFNKSRGYWLIDMGEEAFDILEELGH